jgi:hypothetical protein
MSASTSAARRNEARDRKDLRRVARPMGDDDHGGGSEGLDIGLDTPQVVVSDRRPYPASG